MPTNRTPVDRRSAYRLTPAAIARWRQCRPDGIDLGAPGSGQGAGFEDEQLAALFGESVLLAQRHEDMQALYDALERAVASEGG